MTLLQQREQIRKAARETERTAARKQLKDALHRILPGRRVWVFGSLAHPRNFHRKSDIDIAVDSLPPDLSIYTLTALLEEAMGRPVDVIWLPESRLREKILSEAEQWTT